MQQKHPTLVIQLEDGCLGEWGEGEQRGKWSGEGDKGRQLADRQMWWSYSAVVHLRLLPQNWIIWQSQQQGYNLTRLKGARRHVKWWYCIHPHTLCISPAAAETGNNWQSRSDKRVYFELIIPITAGGGSSSSSSPSISTSWVFWSSTAALEESDSLLTFSRGKFSLLFLPWGCLDGEAEDGTLWALRDLTNSTSLGSGKQK